MNQINTSALIKDLSFESHPIHVFLYNGKLSFLTKEVGAILGISQPTKSLNSSKTLQSGVDYDTISTILIPEKEKYSLSDVNHVSILYLSGFFLFVLRSNKPLAVPFIRWTIREAIPFALENRQQPAIEFKSSDIVKMMELSSRYQCAFSRQKLIDLGFIESNPKNKQLDFDDFSSTNPQKQSTEGEDGK